MEQQKHLDQAADWFDRFDELDEKGKIALSAWLSEEQHQIAFQRIAQAFGQPEVAQAAINVAAKRYDDTSLKNDSAANKKPRQPYVSYWAMAASFVAVAVRMPSSFSISISVSVAARRDECPLAPCAVSLPV